RRAGHRHPAGAGADQQAGALALAGGRGVLQDAGMTRARPRARRARVPTTSGARRAWRWPRARRVDAARPPFPKADGYARLKPPMPPAPRSSAADEAPAPGGFVRVRGAREHNLADVEVLIPREAL